MEQYPIRSVTFGGFQKEDVVRYIEQMAQETNRLKEEEERQRKRADAAEQETERLRAELAETAARRDELERLEPLAQEAERLRQEAEELRADAGAYRQLQQNLGEIECSARRRADELERETAEKLRQTTDQFRARYQQLMSTFEGAASHVTAELRQVEVNLAQLPRAMDRSGAELNELAALLAKKNA